MTGFAWLVIGADMVAAIAVGIAALHRLDQREAAWVNVLTAAFTGVLWPLWLPAWMVWRHFRRPPGRHSVRSQATVAPPRDVEVTSC